MGGIQYSQTKQGGWLGKIDAPLDAKLTAVKWGKYKLGDLFNHIEQGRRLKKVDQQPGNIPFVMSGVTNQGVVGHVANPVASFPANSITIDIFGNAFYRSYAFGAGDDTGVYWNDGVTYTQRQLLFMAATIGKSLSGKYTFGHKLRSSKSSDIKIPLPQTTNGKIDFTFMEEFVHEIEKLRISELENIKKQKLNAYLTALNLTDYTITRDEENAIKQYPSLYWQEFNLKKLFGNSSRGKRLKSDDRLPGMLPFVTAGEINAGISAFIGNKVTVFHKNTTTIDMFGSAKYRNYEYGADDHVAVVHTDHFPQLAAIFVTAACHKAAHTGKFNYGNNFYASDADDLNILLPIKDGVPDIKTMETLIRAAQKLVIKDMVDDSDLHITTAKKIVDKS